MLPGKFFFEVSIKKRPSGSICFIYYDNIYFTFFYHLMIIPIEIETFI